jgi:hypothetical protein
VARIPKVLQPGAPSPVGIHGKLRRTSASSFADLSPVAETTQSANFHDQSICSGKAVLMCAGVAAPARLYRCKHLLVDRSRLVDRHRAVEPRLRSG